MNRRGAIFVSFIFAAVSFFVFLLGALELGRRMVAHSREQTVSDTAALSALTLRAKALGAIAARWNDVGREIISADAGGAFVPRARWNAAAAAASDLSSAISGYQGRVSAVVTVLSAAYGVSRDELVLLDGEGTRIGVTKQTLPLWDEHGDSLSLPAGWYRREWRTDDGGHPRERLAYEFRRGRSRSVLRWDVDLGNADVRAFGNGGYPADWSAARVAGRLEPHRYPFYRVELTDAP